MGNSHEYSTLPGAACPRYPFNKSGWSSGLPIDEYTMSRWQESAMSGNPRRTRIVERRKPQSPAFEKIRAGCKSLFCLDLARTGRVGAEGRAAGPWLD
jgi:hypothetical protein